MAGRSQQMFCLALGAPTKRFELRWEYPLIGCGSSQNISGTSQIRLGTLLSDKGGDSAGVWKSTLLLLQQTSEGGAKGCLADPNGAGFKKIVNQLPAGVGAALRTQMCRSCIADPNAAGFEKNREPTPGRRRGSIADPNAAGFEKIGNRPKNREPAPGRQRGNIADPNAAGFEKIGNRLPAGVGAALRTQMRLVSKKSGTNCWQLVSKKSGTDQKIGNRPKNREPAPGRQRGSIANPNAAGFEKIGNQLPAGVGAALRTQMRLVSKKSGTDPWQAEGQHCGPKCSRFRENREPTASRCRARTQMQRVSKKSGTNPQQA
ncbi:hypothetical protein K438DRAFT_2127491 [Mycena galopus ATCC 62051]|nr:hypothetical protein K438DRAFT_2127491 [Mycena galopus ATCC 62051]